MWRKSEIQCERTRTRAVFHVTLLILALCVFTCCQMLVYDTIKKWHRPFKMFAYACTLWIFPLLVAANASWSLRRAFIGSITCAYLLSELAVLFHEVVIFNWWTPRSQEVLIFIRFALIQSGMKLISMVLISLDYRSRAEMMSACAITGVISTTLYCLFPLVESPFYKITWNFIGESILSQMLNLVLGILTGLLIFTSGRFFGLLTALSFDAPAVGLFIWFSFTGKNLSPLYQSLLILGLMVLTSFFYFLVARRRDRDHPLAADQAPIPIYISGSAVVVS